MKNQNKSDPKENATEVVKQRNPNGSDFRHISTIPDFNIGDLHIIEFSEGDSISQNYVYDDGDSIEIYQRPEEAIRATTNFDPPRESWMGKTMKVGGISGLLAVFITGTICLSFLLQASVPIPNVLSNALTLVLGFYFGSKISDSGSNQE